MKRWRTRWKPSTNRTKLTQSSAPPRAEGKGDPISCGLSAQPLVPTLASNFTLHKSLQSLGCAILLVWNIGSDLKQPLANRLVLKRLD